MLLPSMMKIWKKFTVLKDGTIPINYSHWDGKASKQDTQDQQEPALQV